MNSRSVDCFDILEVDDDVQITVEDALLNGCYEFFNVRSSYPSLWEKYENGSIAPLCGFDCHVAIRELLKGDACYEQRRRDFAASRFKIIRYATENGELRFQTAVLGFAADGPSVFKL